MILAFIAAKHALDHTYSTGDLSGKQKEKIDVAKQQEMTEKMRSGKDNDNNTNGEENHHLSPRSRMMCRQQLKKSIEANHCLCLPLLSQTMNTNPPEEKRKRGCYCHSIHIDSSCRPYLFMVPCWRVHKRLDWERNNNNNHWKRCWARMADGTTTKRILPFLVRLSRCQD